MVFAFDGRLDLFRRYALIKRSVDTGIGVFFTFSLTADFYLNSVNGPRVLD